MSLPHPPRAVIFDMDGPLFDTEALYQRAYLEAAKLGGLRRLARRHPARHRDALGAGPRADAPAAWRAGAAPAAWRQICQADFQKLCPDARPGPGGAIGMCIKQNRASLSDPCKSAIAEARAGWQAQSGPRAAMRQACTADFQKFFPDAKPGAGGIARCIQQNRQSLSESCSTAVAQMRAAAAAERGGWGRRCSRR